MHAEAPYPRFLARGRAFVYVLACRDDTLFKVGFTRDPLHRWLTLHPRFFEFFDLDRSLLVTVERVREARALERRLLLALCDWQALAPLVIRHSAGGHSEWFRGALHIATALCTDTALQQGFAVHQPATPWLRALLVERSAGLPNWVRSMREIIEYEKFNPADDCDRWRRYQRTLDNVLDACRRLNFAVDDLE